MRRRRRFSRRSSRWFSVGRIIRFLIFCLVVGLVLVWLGVTPEGFWRWLGGLAQWVWDVAVSLTGWAAPYVLIGAAIVVPIAILRFFYRRLRA
jgi:H+/Cl- antiporter ClcA